MGLLACMESEPVMNTSKTRCKFRQLLPARGSCITCHLLRNRLFCMLNWTNLNKIQSVISATEMNEF